MMKPSPEPFSIPESPKLSKRLKAALDEYTEAIYRAPSFGHTVTIADARAKLERQIDAYDNSESDMGALGTMAIGYVLRDLAGKLAQRPQGQKTQAKKTATAKKGK